MSSFTKRFLAIGALVVVGGYVGYSLLFPTYHIRYRLSLDVEVNGKVQTTADVIEISYQILPDSLVFAGGPGGAFHGFMHGSAPTIDLGPQGLVFVINTRSIIANRPPRREGWGLARPKSEQLSTLPLVAYGFPPSGMPSTMSGYLTRLQQKKGAIEVPLEILPMFVRFRDITDPNSIEELDPRDFTDAFGPNVHLRSARLELTGEPISPVPAVWPKWLLEAPDTVVRLGRDGNAVPANRLTTDAQIHRSYFIDGIKP